MRDDILAALRSLRHAPSLTGVAVAVLVLAIGATTTVSSVVDAVLLRGLPYDQPHRLVTVVEHDVRQAETFGGGTTTPQAYLDWRRDVGIFETLAASIPTHLWWIDPAGEPILLNAARVTHNFFDALKVRPAIGRTFTVDEERQGHHLVIVSHAVWQQRFGGSNDVLGRTIDIDGVPWEIVGVAPRGFSFPPGLRVPVDAYVPAGFTAADAVRTTERNYGLTVIGRLATGVSLEGAGERMAALGAALDAQYPDWSPGRELRVVSLSAHIVGRAVPWMRLLIGACVLILVIACVNVTNLLLVRAIDRQREFAMRGALGATHVRIVRTMVFEGLVLSLGATALALPMSVVGVSLLRAWLPPELPRLADVTLDFRVAAIAALTAVIVAVAASVAPALRALRMDLTAPMRASSRSSTAGPMARRARGILIVAQVACAVVLLAGAGLFGQSFWQVMRLELGFEHERLLTLNVNVAVRDGRYEEAFGPAQLYLQQMLDAVGRAPGVQEVAAVSGGVPLTGTWSRSKVAFADERTLTGDAASIDRRAVTPNYLSMLGVRVLRGRHIDERDRDDAPLVVIVNESAARLYWPGADPLGARIRINDRERTVVGVVNDIRHLGPEVPPRHEAYLSLAQERSTGASLVIRTTGDALATLPTVRSAIWSVNPNQRLYAASPSVEGHLDRLIAQRRFVMVLFVVFGLVAVWITGIGLYGMLSYLVTQRTPELGIRLALGAQRRQVVSLVARHAAWVTGLGTICGLVAVWRLRTLVDTFLFGVDPLDRGVLLAAVGLLAVVAVIATCAPAYRASRLDPLRALRSEQ